MDEALSGENVTITRHGKPVVELRAAARDKSARPSQQLLDEIAARAKKLPSLGERAVDLIRQMRDE